MGRKQPTAPPAGAIKPPPPPAPPRLVHDESDRIAVALERIVEHLDNKWGYNGPHRCPLGCEGGHTPYEPCPRIPPIAGVPYETP